MNNAVKQTIDVVSEGVKPKKMSSLSTPFCKYTICQDGSRKKVVILENPVKDICANSTLVVQ